MGQRAIRIYLTAEQEELMARADDSTNWAQVFRRACLEELRRQGVIPEVKKPASVS